jgi:hypothetical protein
MESGMVRETVSSADGTFRFLGMQPGRYVLEAQLDGFAPFLAGTFGSRSVRRRRSMCSCKLVRRANK